MAGHTYNVLFLCTGNSARSILAESLLNHWGRGRFRGFSAGSHPKGEVHPIALELLKRLHFPTEGLRSKSWDEFAAAGAPALDFVFTVCDNTAGEVCPYWPGQPMTAHWGLRDPAAVEGSDTEKWLSFRETFRALDNRIKIFTSLPFAQLDRIKLQESLDAIGKTPSSQTPGAPVAGGNGTTVGRGPLTQPGAVTHSEGCYAILESRCRYCATGGCRGGRAADCDGVGCPA
jgi:arsenate reductase